MAHPAERSKIVLRAHDSSPGYRPQREMKAKMVNIYFVLAVLPCSSSENEFAGREPDLKRGISCAFRKANRLAAQTGVE
ncbi:hypothetical protein [Mesorhizobium tianshanense]|uniref:Uncharacterized protein n=1 Tax=Mesorhizobium tianshanense TaxID=39844 RepID=A0A562P5E7_9HYPH|nr:hypothetical protein [Mesorhizobium tianshanense]TWI39674.1 hypothetical protein IQ26_01904 [Mesorhizobium tianshanense]